MEEERDPAIRIMLIGMLILLTLILIATKCRGESSGEIFLWDSNGVGQFYTKAYNKEGIWSKSISYSRTTIQGIDTSNSIGVWSNVWLWKYSFLRLQYDVDFAVQEDKSLVSVGWQFRLKDNFAVEVWNGVIESNVWAYQIGAGTKTRFDIFIFTFKNDLAFYIPVSNIEKPSLLMTNDVDINLMKYFGLTYRNEWALQNLAISQTNRILLKFNF